MDHGDWNTLALIAVALLNLYTAYIAQRTEKIANQTEKNTNSMKDALVRSTAQENWNAGVKHGEDNPRKTPNATPG